MKTNIKVFNAYVFIFFACVSVAVAFSIYEKEKTYTYKTVSELVVSKICSLADIIQYHENIGDPNEIATLSKIYFEKATYVKDICVFKNKECVASKNGSIPGVSTQKYKAQYSNYEDAKSGVWFVKEFWTKNASYEIVYRLDLDDIDERTQSQAISFFVQIGSILTISFTILSLILNKTLVRPISELSEYIKNKDGKPQSFFFIELELLAEAYKEAASGFEALNKTLETKVSQRTFELKKANEALKTVLDSQPNAALVMDNDGIKMANQKFLALFSAPDIPALSKEFDCAKEIFSQDFFLCKKDSCHIAESVAYERGKLKITPKGETAGRVYKVDETRLDENSGLVIVSLADITEMEREREMLELKSNTDALTSLKNRRFFDKAIEFEIIDSKKQNLPLSLIMFDIDKFKNINDTYGHQAGDEALKKLSSLTASHIRQSDILSRFGGEEFAIISLNTNLEAARTLAEKLRKKIEEERISEFFGVTCSFGVASLRAQDDVKELIKRADEALYRAKNGGRNRVESE